MPDTSRHVAPSYNPLRHTLSVHEVEAQLLAAGVPRSRRHIQRLCQNQSFDAAPLGPNDEWYIAPDSVPKVIGDLRAIEEQRSRRVASQRDVSHQVAAEKSLTTANDMSRHDASQRDTAAAQNKEEGSTTSNDTSRYVAQLEKRIEEKDKTIDFLQEELVDRRSQIGGMKEIIDGQRLLLESINTNVAPVFTALAEVARGKPDARDVVRATIVDAGGKGKSSMPTRPLIPTPRATNNDHGRIMPA
jgi:hypothetical protein